MLFLRYEEMKADLRTTLATVARHLRIDPPPDERELDRLAAACGLEGMRAHRERYEPRSVAWRDPAFRFIRKGEVGDHAALFTPAQHARFARGLFGRYAAVMVGGEGGDGERDGEPRPGVLPSYVTGALVGGEEGLLVAAAGGGGGGKGCVVDGEGHV